MYAHFSVYVFINCKQKPSIILNLKRYRGDTLRECKGNQLQSELLFMELMGTNVLCRLFCGCTVVHFCGSILGTFCKKILRNVVFWFRNHIFSGQCGHSNAVCVLFFILLVCFFSSFNSQNRWKIGKNCKCEHHDTETHWCKSQEVFHNFSNIFKVHSLNVTPSWLRLITTENFKTIQH